MLTITPLGALRLFGYLRPHLANEAQNKSRFSTDAHRQFTTMGRDVEMLSVVPREGAWQGHSDCSGACRLYKGSLQNKRKRRFLDPE